MLSTYVEPVWAVSLLDAVADGVGYLLKDRVDDVGALLDALRRVAAGGVALDPEVVIALVAKRRHSSALPRLTDKELAVLTLLAEGKSNAGSPRSCSYHPRQLRATWRRSSVPLTSRASTR